MKIEKELRPFISDGCLGFTSFLYKIFTGKCLPWEQDCLEHDRAYWKGGDLKLRRIADRKLAKAICDKGYLITSIIFYIAIRIGGQYWIPFPTLIKEPNIFHDGINNPVTQEKWKLVFNNVRWGYGYKYPKYK